MYKIPHNELLMYKAYVAGIHNAVFQDRPPIASDGLSEDKFTFQLNETIFAGQYGNSMLVVDDGKTIHYNATLGLNANDLILPPIILGNGTVYDVEKHSVYLLSRQDMDRLSAISDYKGFNIGASRFRHYEGKNTLILMGLESDVTVVSFYIDLPYRASVRYITKLENCCILNTNYERIPANQITEQQLITALEQCLCDESGLIKVYTPTIHTVRSNVEITEVELYTGVPIPQPT